MQELSKKPEIESKISRLENEIRERDRDFDDEQGKRVKRTFFVLYGIVAFIILGIAFNDGINLHGLGAVGVIKEIFHALYTLTIGAGIVAAAIMFISSAVWNYVHSGALNRVRTIAKMEGELQTLKYDIERYIKEYDDIIVKLERELYELKYDIKEYQELLDFEYDYMEEDIEEEEI